MTPAPSYKSDMVRPGSPAPSYKRVDLKDQAKGKCMGGGGGVMVQEI
jgi:hypothetical protein